MARATRFLVGENRKRVQRLLRLTRSPAIEDQLMPEQGERPLAVDGQRNAGAVQPRPQALPRFA